MRHDRGASGDERRRIEELTEEVQGLRAALESRAVIDQAKGIVMATMGCDAAEAFEILKTESQHTNRKLRDVAEELVAQQKKRRMP